MNTNESVLIAGGYGVVGTQLAEIIRQQYPDLPLLIAGRNPAKGEALARRLSLTDVIQMDVEQPNPLSGVRPRAIIAAVNDPHDNLLMDAIQGGIPYLDIARWTGRVKQAASMLDGKTRHARVMLSSGWMAGVASLLAVTASRLLRRVERIDISVLYSLKDKAGLNSVEYMDRLATPFEVMLNGEWKQVFPYTDPRRITFPGGQTTQVYRFDTPDQISLPETTGAGTVAARIAFDDALSTRLLVFLTRSGIWKRISGERFTALRRSILYNPGSGASHEMVIEAAGLDENGLSRTIRAAVLDPQGQTHLSALGALIQLERLLGLDGAPPPLPGIVYPDTAPQIDSALHMLRKFGVSVTIG